MNAERLVSDGQMMSSAFDAIKAITVPSRDPKKKKLEGPRSSF